MCLLQQGSAFPRLQKLAKKVLAIPATSAIVERLFSHAGFIINIRRTNLATKTVDAHVFLHKHYSKDRKRKREEEEKKREMEAAAALALEQGFSA